MGFRVKGLKHSKGHFLPHHQRHRSLRAALKQLQGQWPHGDDMQEEKQDCLASKDNFEQIDDEGGVDEVEVEVEEPKSECLPE